MCSVVNLGRKITHQRWGGNIEHKSGKLFHTCVVLPLLEFLQASEFVALYIQANQPTEHKVGFIILLEAQGSALRAAPPRNSLRPLRLCGY